MSTKTIIQIFKGELLAVSFIEGPAKKTYIYLNQSGDPI